MPTDLVLVRHGESEGNVLAANAQAGDFSAHTDAAVTTPGDRWRLTDLGRTQAAVIGGWLADAFPGEAGGPGFDRYDVSPYVRARETAGLLGLPGAAWRMNRSLRERAWGEIGSLPYDAFAERYPDNARTKDADPLYWVPPGGESIAQVTEGRVRNVLSLWHRECSGLRVLAVSHGALMWSMRLVLERWDDEAFTRRDGHEADHIGNCTALHYTRTDPHTGVPAADLGYLRAGRPVLRDGAWSVEVTPWVAFGRPPLGNAELLASIADVPSVLSAGGT